MSSHVQVRFSEKPQYSYEELVLNAQCRFPTLIFLNEEFRRQDHRTGDLRVAVFESSEPVRAGDITSTPTHIATFRTAEGLRRHLGPGVSSIVDRPTRLFVLEDIVKPYILTLAEHLDNYLDATVVASHLRMRDSTHFTKSNAPTIESLNPRKSSFSITYQELHPGMPRAGPNAPGQQRSVLFCDANVHREILVADTTTSHVDTNLAIVPRKITFWNHGQGDGEWAGVLLLDPPLGDSIVRARSKNAEERELVKLVAEDWFPENGLYHGGYVDIEGWPTRPATCDPDSICKGPSRKSALDDFVFHWARRHEQAGGNSRGQAHRRPSETRNAVRDIAEAMAISNWIVPIEYLRHKFFQLEISTQDGMSVEDLSSRKEVYRWKRNCALFIEEVRSSMASLKGTLEEGESLNSGWAYVVDNLEALHGRVGNIAETSLALLSILESHKSLQEAKDVGNLTRLGMFFLPLSFTAGIFSMASDYAPGSDYCWVYFAVGVPLTLTVLFLASLEYVANRAKPLGKSILGAKLSNFGVTWAWRKAHGVESLYDLEKTLHPKGRQS